MVFAIKLPPKTVRPETIRQWTRVNLVEQLEWESGTAGEAGIGSGKRICDV